MDKHYSLGIFPPLIAEYTAPSHGEPVVFLADPAQQHSPTNTDQSPSGLGSRPIVSSLDGRRLRFTTQADDADDQVVHNFQRGCVPRILSCQPGLKPRTQLRVLYGWVEELR
jgi:hypothetical protein